MDSLFVQNHGIIKKKNKMMKQKRRGGKYKKKFPEIQGTRETPLFPISWIEKIRFGCILWAQLCKPDGFGLDPIRPKCNV